MALSIQGRLTLGSLFLYALMMFSVGLGLFYLMRVNTEAENVLADNYDSVRHIHGMQRELDRDAADNSAALAVIDSLLGAQEHNITEPGEQATTSALREHFNSWRTGAAPVSAPPLLMRRDLDRLLDLNLHAISRKSAIAQRNAGHALFWLFLLAVLITMVGLGFSVAFPTVMSAPIVRLKEAVKELAAGNYRHRIPPFKMKELDELAKAFNDMARELERYDNSNMARMMAEKNRAEAVINSLQDASIGVNDEGIVLFANQQALELLGASAAQVVGQEVSEMAAQNDLLEHILSDKASAPFKVVLDGRENYFIGSSVTIRGAGGSLGQLYVLRNITPFQERDLAKTNFLATISHELKTPLASTDIGLTLLERQGAPFTAEQSAIVADLRKDHKRLVRIVSELLDLAQAETGNIRLHMSEIPLQRVVTEALDSVKMNAQQKNLHFDIRINPTDRPLRADPDKAVWVLVNLLSNAIRHSPTGGVISIVANSFTEHMEVIVSDDGPGIPAEAREHIFERFSRRTDNNLAGTGLGLSIAKEFMEAMGGGILLDRTRPTGASFALRFPTGPELHDHPK